MHSSDNERNRMDAQLRLDMQSVLKRTHKRGFDIGRKEGLEQGRAQMAEELRVPILTIAVVVFAAGIAIGVFIP